MKQSRSQLSKQKYNQFSVFQQTKTNTESLLDLDQQEMAHYCKNNCTSNSKNIERTSIMENAKNSGLANALNMQKFNLFLSSSNQDFNETKPQNKRPKTLIDTRKSPLKNKDKQSDLSIMMTFHSSPNNALRGENESENQDEPQINIRTFQSKFIRELNFRDNQRLNKSRKRIQINKKNELNEQKISSRMNKTAKLHIKKAQQQIWYNGVRVLSEFRNDLIHGQTQVFYPNGAKFIGRYQQGVRIFGQFDFNNGYTYSGSFWGDKFQGEGQLKLPNGKVFSGDWFENQIIGKAQIKYPSGDVYYGEIKDFKKHGKGYLFFKNGQKFVGEFQNGSITGKGQYFINQQCVGRGFWKEGELIQKVQENEQFSFFDSPTNQSRQTLATKKSLTPQYSTCQKLNKQSISQSSPRHSDCLAFEDITIINQQQQSPIQIRSNKKMISFNEIKMNKQQSDNKLYMRGNNNKKVSISQNACCQYHKNKDDNDKENLFKKTVSEKSRSSRRLRPQKIKRPQQKVVQPTDTFDDDECQQTNQIIELCNDVLTLNPNQTDNQSISTTKTTKGGYLNTSQHSQSSQAGLFKTGKFNSFNSLKRSVPQ